MNESFTHFSGFWDHLEELRQIFIKIMWVVLMGTGIAFLFHQPILHFLTTPLPQSLQHPDLLTYDIKTHRIINKGQNFALFRLPKEGLIKDQSPEVKWVEDDQFYLPANGYVEWEEAKPSTSLLLLGPMEGLTLSLKVSFWVGFTCTSPIWLYFIFQFVAPALHQKEKLLVLPFISMSFIFITLGLCFAYFITIPIANRYLLVFNEGLGLNLWSLMNYMDYTFFLLLSSAIAFELFVVAFLLVHYGFLKVGLMKNKRKHAIVASFILGALLTPPIFFRIFVAIPMIILYECTILYALLRESRKKNAEAKS